MFNDPFLYNKINKKKEVENLNPNEYSFHSQINEDTKEKLIAITKKISESLENSGYANLNNFKESFLVAYPGGPRIETIKFAFEKDGSKFFVEVSKIND